jgi:probable rRNA maturation factor
MSITIQVSRIPGLPNTKIPLNVKRLRRLISRVCGHFQVSAAIIGVEIVGDSEIRKINRKYLKSSRTTDCISFDLTENKDRKLFQIIVNAEKAAREAKKRGHTAEAELALYVLHGLLHNLGLDDRRQTDARLMHRKEDYFLQRLGYGQVYNNRRKA